MHLPPGNGRLVAGRYRLLDQLGRGAMGVVWHGRDELLGRDVAVKQVVLPPMASDADTRASYQRTLREARTAAKLSHPGVITVFDVIEEDGAPWIVMELIRARPLDQVIAEDGPLPPAQAAHLGLTLLDALTTAHAAGVLHRDVKPSNVMISPDGKAVLTDFGLATVQGDPGLTQAGMVVGTPGFSPPERVRGAEATPSSDLWSLGATLYAAVEGRGPFDRAGGSTAIVASIATEPAPRAPSAGPLAPVIDLLLRADPAERPDAAAAARLLSTAWTDARRLDRFGGGLQVTRKGLDPRAQSDPAPLDTDVLVGSMPASGGVEATTATQVVTVRSGDATDDSARSQASLGGQIGGGAAGPIGADSGSLGAGSAAGGASGAAGAHGGGSGALDGAWGADVYVSAIDVVPDLMATPVFAELRMPTQAEAYGETGTGALGVSAAGDAYRGSQARAGSEASECGARRRDGLLRGKIGQLAHSRRGLTLTAPVLVPALVAGIVFLAFPGIGHNFGHFLSRIPGGSTFDSGLGRSSLGTTAPAAPGSAKPGRHRSSGGQRPSAGPTPTGSRGRPTPRSSGHPSPSPTTGSNEPSSSASPSPSPTPSPTPVATLPTGYAWRSVSAQAIGTTAGFRLAAPAAWVVTAGVQTYLRPALGGARMEVDMAPFAAAGPLKEAKYLQQSAIAHHRYRRYHLISILLQRFHGRPAASWTFWWKPLNWPRRVVTEIIFTAQTTAGPQPYIVSMAAPATVAAYASQILRVAMRTFSPLT